MPVQTEMKYPYLMDIWKGAMTTARVASDIAWKDKTIYRLLRSLAQPDTLTNEGEKFLDMRLSPQNRLQEIFVLHYL